MDLAGKGKYIDFEGFHVYLEFCIAEALHRNNQMGTTLFIGLPRCKD